MRNMRSVISSFTKRKLSDLNAKYHIAVWVISISGPKKYKNILNLNDNTKPANKNINDKPNIILQ
jgi:trehalose-6-phosphatase